ncbi:hypothetical protein [Roseococcus sp. YIM B11640]|uniref:hypothetical protein n=1 Tax=Roseococcus sp. YIM B11640 TaxID=3133973 RepID=UPI003C7C08B5
MIVHPARFGLFLLLVTSLGACQPPTPAQEASAEDRQCRGYGFEPGSERYVTCRSMIGERRAIEAGRSPGSGNPAGLPIYAAPPLMPSPREVGCRIIQSGSQRFTNCP